MTRRNRKRQRLLEVGAAALASTLPVPVPGTYICPICLRGTSRLEFFSLEDVPPKSIGGRPLLLTCRECNHRSGYQLDHHIRTADEISRIAAGEASLDIRYEFEGESIAASLEFVDGGISITGHPSRSHPESHKRLFEKLSSPHPEGSPRQFSISYRVKHDPWKESVAWLRIAYLYAFAALGYRYILRPELSPIRAQILSPDEQNLTGIVKRQKHPVAEKGLLFVPESESLRGIVFFYRDVVVFLPGLRSDLGFYERVRGIAHDELPSRLSGKILPLPTTAEYILDFDPRFAGLVHSNENAS